MLDMLWCSLKPLQYTRGYVLKPLQYGRRMWFRVLCVFKLWSCGVSVALSVLCDGASVLMVPLQ
jgi:hypothetical protein